MHLAQAAVTVAAPATVFAGYHFLRFLVWVLRGGSRVSVPWECGAVPRHSVFAQRTRTRDGSLLVVRHPEVCRLLLWRRPRGWRGASRLGAPVALSTLLADAATGWTGIWAVAVDCGLEAGGERWVITSGEFRWRKRRLSGPHYAPLAACHGSAVATIDISAYIDGRRLLEDLRGFVADTAIQQTGPRESLDFLLGRMRADRVHCSGLAGRAILKQPACALAQALRRALGDRYTPGDVTPADLARAAAILGLCPEGTVTPFRTVPILRPRAATRRAKQPRLQTFQGSSEAPL